MKAVVVGSMNCLPTEYAILLKKYCNPVIHYYDADEHDTLSNPRIRWGDDSVQVTQGVTIKKIAFHHHLSYLFPWLFHFKLLAQLKSADLILLSGPSISLARWLAGKQVVALAYGNDISLFCNPEWPAMSVSEVTGLKRFIKPFLRYLKSRFVSAQVSGLKSCTHYSYFVPGFDIEIDSLLERLLAGADQPKRLTRYSINIDILEMARFRAPLPPLPECYRILFPVRFSQGNELLGDKGWKLLFDGLKKYKAIAKRKFICICFKKGNYFDAMAYAKAQGIEDVVKWQDVVSFDILIQYYRRSDVVVEQLGTHWIGQGLYAMALGKPVIGRVSTKSQKDFFKESGLLQVENVDQLVAHLSKCESKEYCESTGNKSSQFVRTSANIESEFLQWRLL